MTKLILNKEKQMKLWNISKKLSKFTNEAENSIFCKLVREIYTSEIESYALKIKQEEKSILDKVI